MKAVPCLSNDMLKKAAEQLENKHRKVTKAMFLILLFTSIWARLHLENKKICIQGYLNGTNFKVSTGEQVIWEISVY